MASKKAKKGQPELPFYLNERVPITLAELRRRRGMTQAELAKKMHCSRSSVSRIERSKDPSIRALHRFAYGLGATIHMSFVRADGSVIKLGA